MKRVIFLLVCLLLISQVSAIGLSGKQLVYKFDFQPGLTKLLEYRVKSTAGMAMNYTLYATGPLADHVTFSADKIFLRPGESKWFKVLLELPTLDVYDPGLHTTYIGIQEEIAAGVGAAAKTGVEARIVIRVLEPGKLLKSALSTPNIAVGEAAPISIELQNWGRTTIDDVWAKIFLNDLSADTEHVSVVGGGKSSLRGVLPTSELMPGEYNISAKIFWDGKEDNMDAVLRIGQYNIEIIDYTYNFKRNEINPFIINIRSKWNRVIENVYAKIKIGDDVITSPTIRLGPWEELNITTYWEPKLLTGDYKGVLQVFFSEKKKEEPISVLIEEHVEEQVQAPISSSHQIVFYGAIVLIFVILVNIAAWFILLRKKRRKK